MDRLLNNKQQLAPPSRTIYKTSYGRYDAHISVHARNAAKKNIFYSIYLLQSQILYANDSRERKKLIDQLLNILYSRFLVTFTTNDIIGPFWARLIFDLLKRLIAIENKDLNLKDLLSKLMPVFKSCVNVYISSEIFLHTRVRELAHLQARSFVPIAKNLQILYTAALQTNASTDNPICNQLTYSSTVPNQWQIEPILINTVMANGMQHKDWSEMIAHMNNTPAIPCVTRISGKAGNLEPIRVNDYFGDLPKVWSELVIRTRRLKNNIVAHRAIRLHLEVELKRDFSMPPADPQEPELTDIEDPVSFRLSLEDFNQIHRLARQYIILTRGVDGCLEFLLTCALDPGETPALAHIGSSYESTPICLWTLLSRDLQNLATKIALTSLILIPDCGLECWLHATITCCIAEFESTAPLPKQVRRLLRTREQQLNKLLALTISKEDRIDYLIELFLLSCCLPVQNHTKEAIEQAAASIGALDLETDTLPDYLAKELSPAASVLVTRSGVRVPDIFVRQSLLHIFASENDATSEGDAEIATNVLHDRGDLDSAEHFLADALEFDLAAQQFHWADDSGV